MTPQLILLSGSILSMFALTGSSTAPPEGFSGSSGVDVLKVEHSLNSAVLPQYEALEITFRHEREYVRAMQDFAYRLDKDVRTHAVTISRPEAVRGYALASQRRAGIYLHHVRTHAECIADLRIEVDLPGQTRGYWYDPEDASIIRVVDIAGGMTRLDVPPFMVDIALLVTPDGPPDIDNDGRPNHLDADDDEDGVPDERDAFPLDPKEWRDTDGDGIGDNGDPDDDNDGFSDAEERQAGTAPLDGLRFPTR